MKTFMLAGLLSAAAALPAVAQESSYQFTGSIGLWGNQDGGSNFESNDGLDG
jgi:hypothetical protein